MQTYHCYINGEWIKKSSGNSIEVENPANGELFANIYCSSREEVSHAIDSAEKAQFGWNKVEYNTRKY